MFRVKVLSNLEYLICISTQNTMKCHIFTGYSFPNVIICCFSLLYTIAKWISVFWSGGWTKKIASYHQFKLTLVIGNFHYCQSFYRLRDQCDQFWNPSIVTIILSCSPKTIESKTKLNSKAWLCPITNSMTFLNFNFLFHSLEHIPDL